MFGKNDLFMAPDGNDEWDGGREFPIPENHEGPLASLEGALARLRQLKNSGLLSAPLTVWIRGGHYPMRRTLVLTPADSAPVCFRAYPGETPVFDGGMALTGWEAVRLNGHEVLRAKVPAEGCRGGRVDQLFVNGQRKRQAAFPREGSFRVAASPEGPTGKLFNGSDRFHTEPGDFNPDWYDLSGIEAEITHKWIEERMPLEAFDRATGVLRSACSSRFELDPADTEYRLLNVREALTASGEYYFDRNEKMLYYLPEAGEEAATLRAAVPGLGGFIRAEGKPSSEGGKYVEWLTFDGLTFIHGGAGRPAVGLDYDFGDAAAASQRNFAIRAEWFNEFCRHSGKPLAGSPQAAAHLPGLLSWFGARHCVVTNCTVAHSGWYGIGIGAGCSGLRLERNHLHDLGGGGIMIGGADAACGAGHPERLTSRIIVCDNHIHDCGKVHFSAVGILITHAFANLVEHNHIHDLFYSGISCGWSWGYGETVTRENRIGWNRIHGLGKGVLSDMGGIYLLGIQPGTRVCNNLVFEVKCRYYGGWGIYTDEGSSHIVIEENICCDCSCEGFHQHFGRENIVRHNVFAFPGEYGMAISAGTGRMTGYGFPGRNYTVNLNFFGNILLVDGKPFFRNGYQPGTLRASEFFSEANCFWDVSGKSEVFATEPDKWKMSWEEWRESGHDRSSLYCDPEFVDPAARDFRLQSESPLRNGPFRSLDLTRAGVRPLVVEAE